MYSTDELSEYLSEIRRHVCSRCPERPPDGPPCEPLGKRCGVERHLEKIIDVIHQAHSDSMAPYLEKVKAQICSFCDFRGSHVCPCPMDLLAVLVVEAVEAVDARSVGN